MPLTRQQWEQQQATDGSAAIVPINPPRLTMDTLALITLIAADWHASRYFNCTPEQAKVIMAKAADLGLPPTSAFDLIKPIPTANGMDLALSPRGAQALILASGLLEAMKITEQPDSCTVWMRRRGGLEYHLTYTLEDAQKAELTEGSPTSGGKQRGRGAYEKWQANMLRWRALGFVQDVLFPDVCGGLSSAAKYPDVVISPDGAVIDALPVDEEADDA